LHNKFIDFRIGCENKRVGWHRKQTDNGIRGFVISRRFTGEEISHPENFAFTKNKNSGCAEVGGECEFEKLTEVYVIARALLFFARSNPRINMRLLRREEHPPRNDMLIPPTAPKPFRQLKKRRGENTKSQNDFAREIGVQNKLDIPFCEKCEGY